MSTRIEAVHILYKKVHHYNGENFFDIDGNVITFSDEEEKEISAKVKEIDDNYSSQEYARKREAEYPTIQECVHAILDDDLEALQEKRKAVKTKYPKS